MILEYYVKPYSKRIAFLRVFADYGRKVSVSKLKPMNYTRMIAEYEEIKKTMPLSNIFNVVVYQRIKHYKYYCWLNKLPQRGQRTHTNAQTIRYMVIHE